jgi:hypothetical protein
MNHRINVFNVLLETAADHRNPKNPHRFQNVHARCGGIAAILTREPSVIQPPVP